MVIYNEIIYEIIYGSGLMVDKHDDYIWKKLNQIEYNISNIEKRKV